MPGEPIFKLTENVTVNIDESTGDEPHLNNIGPGLGIDVRTGYLVLNEAGGGISDVVLFGLGAGGARAPAAIMFTDDEVGQIAFGSPNNVLAPYHFTEDNIRDGVVFYNNTRILLDANKQVFMSENNSSMDYSVDSGGFKITYHVTSDLDPVPEPAGLMIMGIGIFGLFGCVCYRTSNRGARRVHSHITS